MKRVLLLMSDTGGGHRACATAISEAFQAYFPHQVSCEIVDGLKNLRFPFTKATPIYPWLTRSKKLWSANFTHTDSPDAVKTLTQLFWPLVKSPLENLLLDHPADLIVSLHPLLTHVVSKALDQLHLHSKFAVVVTDPFTPHSAWFTPLANHYFVSSSEAQTKAISNGIPKSVITISPHPISPTFSSLPPKPQNTPPHLLFMGGGQGLGEFYKTAIALDTSTYPFSLTLITGKNPTLLKKLEKTPFSHTTTILGYTPDIATFMNTADLLITKAGPSTIFEALACKIPLVIYDYLPGQEQGNLDFVISQNAGLYCPTPKKLISAINQLLSHPEQLSSLSQKSSQLSSPDSAKILANHLLKLI
jgi:1,2-diacylglycerol 3-beta-galactosyltransferase